MTFEPSDPDYVSKDHSLNEYGVQRYEISFCAGNDMTECGAEMTTWKKGDWVKYSDYEKIYSALKSAKALLDGVLDGELGHEWGHEWGENFQADWEQITEALDEL